MKVLLSKNNKSASSSLVGRRSDHADLLQTKWGVPSHRANRPLRFACIVILLVTLAAINAYAADLIFIRSTDSSSQEQQQLEIATHFYGLNLQLVTANSESVEHTLQNVIERRETVAVAIAANALGRMNQKSLWQSLKRKPGDSIPLLIVGVTPETDFNLLRAWSGGAAVGCTHLAGPLRPRYGIANIDGVTHQLSNVNIPFSGNDTNYFLLNQNRGAQQIMVVRSDGGDLPVFIETTVDKVKVFLARRPSSNEVAIQSTSEDIVLAFSQIAPAMMFIRYSAGERAWHSPHHYANLTIDDPWLREPYGYLDYSGLLEEMKKHGFHSTVAFIPWNYDRSQPKVVSLFRDHSDRFSICVHGDNHDHKEFTDYRSKPLSAQVAAIRQALARMDKFHALTGIPYDKVMVFPHSMAPDSTLGVLKTYNYLATINSSDVPMDRPKPPLLPFALRPVTLEFSNFASILRYPVEMGTPNGFLAINEFLDNPLFFYCHHDFFSSGINAFDGVADKVNKLEPDTRWVSVGDIVRHLYLIKVASNSQYDVLALSSDFYLENMSGRSSIFNVNKAEAGNASLRSVTVDGQEYSYRLAKGSLDLTIPIQAHQSRHVVIQYDNDLSSTTTDISKNSARVYILRMASDFRDISLPRHTAGRALIALYYGGGLKHTWALVSLMMLLALCLWVAYQLRNTIHTFCQVNRARRDT